MEAWEEVFLLSWDCFQAMDVWMWGDSKNKGNSEAEGDEGNEQKEGKNLQKAPAHLKNWGKPTMIKYQ